jgi:hypothetical protein
VLLHVSTLLCHLQGACSQYLLSIINAVMVTQFKISSMLFVESQCLKSLNYENFSSYNKMAKIVLSLQFLWSPVWWLYIQSVCWCFRCVGPVCTESECVSSRVTCFVTLATAYIEEYLAFTENRTTIPPTSSTYDSHCTAYEIPAPHASRNWCPDTYVRYTWKRMDMRRESVSHRWRTVQYYTS